LNNGTYLVSNYRFKKFTSTRQFTASFDSKFQFYENLLFVTPLITEKFVYYKIYDQNDAELPSYLLKYFKCSGDEQLLSNVAVSLVDNAVNKVPKIYSTTFNYTQEVCSIFNVELKGSTDSINYETIVGASTSYLDPFFNLKSTINGFDSANAVGTVTVKLANGTTIDQSQYYIQTVNAQGANKSFTAKRYTYTLSSLSANALSDFSYYNDFYNSLSMTSCDAVLTLDGSDCVLSIYDGEVLLATITQPADFIDNYNIIVCTWPLFKVESSYNGNYWFNGPFYTLAVYNTIEVDSGVYYYNTANPSVGMSESFSLISDSFSLKFCNDSNSTFPNNTQYANQTLFTQSNTYDNRLYCDNVLPNQNVTKSVAFEWVRGYNSYTNSDLPKTGTTYRDVIVLARTPATLTFSLTPIAGGDLDVSGTTAVKASEDIYVGKVITLDTVVGQDTNPQIYNLGLKLNILESILSNSEDLIYNINATVADYLVNVDSNPYEPNLIDVVSYGYLTDIETNNNAGPNVQKNLFYPYISGIKACSIKASSVYTLTIRRNVPDLKVYSLTNRSYIGNPVTADTSDNVWTWEGDITYNSFLWTGYLLSNLWVRRLAAEGADGNGNGHVVFYNNYHSYYVVAPPSVSIYGYPSTGSNKVNVYNLPISGINSIFFTAYDISASNIYTDIAHSSGTLTFRQTGPYYYTRYLSLHDKYYFFIESNLIKIDLFIGGAGNSGGNIDPTNAGQPVLNDENGVSHETLFDWQLISDLYGSDYLDVTTDSSLNYLIDYNQILYQTGNHFNNKNIHFTIGNAFTGPNRNANAGAPSYYLRLPSPLGTSISFYQANIIYSDVSGIDGLRYGYYMVIDKFDTPEAVNYNTILSGTNYREVFFPVNSHSSKQILLGDISDGSGNVIDQQDYLNEIIYDDVANVDWVIDNEFSTQYLGITISGLSNKGIADMKDLLEYNQINALQSKVLYVKRQDAIRIVNALGNNVFRVTNSGNVHSQRVITSNVSLYTPPNVMPNIQDGSIGGSADIISIFAQDTILNESNPQL